MKQTILIFLLIIAGLVMLVTGIAAFICLIAGLPIAGVTLALSAYGSYTLGNNINDCI